MNPVDTSAMPPVAIIGVSCLFPGAAGVEAYWANILNRVDAIGDIPPDHWRAQDYFDVDPKAADMTYARRGGFLTPVDLPLLEFGIAPNTLEAIDSTQLLGLVVASRALEDAGYGAGRTFDRTRTSVILGVTGTLPLVIPLGARLGHPLWRRALREADVAEDVAERVVQRIADQYVGWQESSFPGLLGNVVAGRIANRLDLGGTNCVVDAACASSLSALHLALCELASGRTDMVLTGGMDCFNDVFMYVCFSKSLALSRTGSARPFDVSCDGTILGEGLGCLVLKRVADAERDGDHVYALIRGVGASSDGKGQAIYAPSPAGQVRALRQAYELAGVTPETIELVEAHGTGTRAGDAAEVEALTAVYDGAPNSRCALGSVKSQIGHTKAAAGVAGLIKAALALHHKVLPPTINVTQPIEPLLPGQSPFYVNTEARPWLRRPEHPRRAGVSSFGFGGSNFHCVLEECQPEKQDISWDGATQIVALAAESVDALRDAAASWPRASEAGTHSWDDIRVAAARSRAEFRPGANCRLVVVLEKNRTDLTRPLGRVSALLAQDGMQPSWTTPDGIYFGTGMAAGGVAMLFPGQGSQYVGMLRELACLFPMMLTTLSEADVAFADSRPGRRLSDFIHPPSVFSAEDFAKNDAALRAVDIAQPALGAVSVGALRVLEHFGVRPDATGGHSYGELVALHAAGRLDAAALHRLSNSRGRFMADGAGDPGGMLAVQASVTTAEQVLREAAIDLCIANKNAPLQTVLSGKTSEIERAIAAFAAQGIPSRQLAVAAAFHSPLVAHVREQFATELQAVAVTQGEVPVYSNTTAEAYPADSQQARTLLAGQLAEPVAFADQINRMYAAGIRTFLEVGPSHTLTGLVNAILGDREHAALALDASSGRRSGGVDLARTLAQLAAFGHAVDLTRWDEPGHVKSAPTSSGITVPISGANYVRPGPAPKRESPPDSQHATITDEGRPVPQPAMNAEAVSKPRPADADAATHARSAIESERLSAALRATEDNLLALQKLGEQTARLHAQFLENQTRTLEVFQALMHQQQRMLHGSVAPTTERTSQAAMPQLASMASNVATPVDDVEVASAPVEGDDTLSAPVTSPGRTSSAGVAPATAERAASARFDRTAVAETLVAIVAETTGYPADVLRLEMELDADLGIDSIKRVEIFSAIQETLPDAPPVTPQHIGSLRTLQSLVDFYLQGAVTPATTAATPAAVSTVPKVELDTPPADAVAVSPVVGNLKRYVLQRKPLPSSLVGSRRHVDSSAEIWVTADDTGLAGEIVARLRALGYQSRLVGLEHSDALPAPLALAGLVVVAPRSPSADDLLRNAFRLLQRIGSSLRAAARSGGALFCTVARLDGAFGLASLSANANLLSGGLAGLVKTAALEWPDVHCKAIDLAEGVDADAGAPPIVDEMLAPGAVEVGIDAESRWQLALCETRLDTTTPDERPIASRRQPRLQRSDVVVVSGGARGVTAEAVVALAQSFGVSVVLLGRSPRPQPEPDWLTTLTSEGEIKKALAARATSGVTPRELGDQYRSLMASREVRRTLGRLEAAGVTARYDSVDVRDEQAVGNVLADVRSRLGPVRAIVHGAGVLADRAIEEKTLAEFDRVYATKVAGLRSLLAGVNLDDLELLALFSSSTARIGRVGQVDYAVANEVLNKTARQLAGRLPNCRVIAFNWGPWDGGMVTSSLKKVFEAEGIGLMPMNDGAAFFLREISSGARDVEVVAMAGDVPLARARAARPSATDQLLVAFERELTVEQFPVLRSHVLARRAVVPTALVVEWLAHGAMHNHPGLAFHGFDELRVLKGIRVSEQETHRIRVLAGKSTEQESLHRVPVELHGIGRDGKHVLHARATIVLTRRLPEAPPSPDVSFPSHAIRDAASIYRDLLFHGPDMRGLVAIEGLSEQGAGAVAQAAPSPATWIQQPLRGEWIADPLALDSAFQLISVWCHDHRGSFSLPTFAGEYRQFRRAYPSDVRVLALVREQHTHRAIADLWFVDTEGQTIACMTNYECVIDPSLDQAFRANQLHAAALPSA